jgi:hypothetical protein
MTSEAADLEKRIALFSNMLTAARQAVGGHDKIILFAGDRKDHPTIIRWAYLYRMLNLGDSALLCASHRHGEALAVIARSIMELTFVVARIARDPKAIAGFGKFSLAKTAKEFREMKALLSKQANPDQEYLQQIQKAIESASATGTKGFNEKDYTFLELAKQAGMEEDYRTRYSFLCFETHHRQGCERHYLRQRRDGVELHQSQDIGLISVLLGMAIGCWARSTTLLLKECKIAFDARLQDSFAGAMRSVSPGVASKQPETGNIAPPGK